MTKAGDVGAKKKATTKRPTKDKLYQWATTYPDGSTGAISELIPGVGHVPLYARTREMAERMRPIALHHKARTNQKVWLRVWTVYIDEPELELDLPIQEYAIFSSPIR